MGRKQRPGISFYRMDCGHIRNKKVRLLCNEFDSDGYYIWSALLDYGYSTWGYYFDLNDNDEFELFATEYCKKKISQIREVIAGCIRRGLFDKRVADTFGILTCHDMQEIFLYATADRRKKGSVFEIQEDWLIYDFKGIVPVNISIVPGKKEIPPGNNSQTETKTETQTEEKSSAPAPPARPKKLVKKQDKETEPYWQLLVDAFFDFYKSKFKGEEPSFAGRIPKLFKDLIALLKTRAGKKKTEWSETNAVASLNYFLGLAYSEDWLSKHFLVKNLVEQFDSIYQRALDSKDPNKGKEKKQTHKSTGKTSNELSYLVEATRDGTLDDRVITPEIYSSLERMDLVPRDYYKRFEGNTMDEQAKAATLEWLRLQI